MDMVEAIDTDILLQDNEADVNTILYTDETYASSDDEDNNDNQLDRKISNRGITRLAKFRLQYGHPGQVKHKVTIDTLNRVTGLNRALFASFLGDAVREHIGLKVLSWKKVDKESIQKLWDEIMVHIY
jgi:hypothetical protein